MTNYRGKHASNVRAPFSLRDTFRMGRHARPSRPTALFTAVEATVATGAEVGSSFDVEMAADGVPYLSGVATLMAGRELLEDIFRPASGKRKVSEITSDALMATAHLNAFTNSLAHYLDHPGLHVAAAAATTVAYGRSIYVEYREGREYDARSVAATLARAQARETK